MIITVANQKGGVGKTDVSVNLASSLASCGKKVLLMDMDPQANATTYVTDNVHEKTTRHLLLDDKATIENVAVKTKIVNLDIIPASPDLYAAQVELMNEAGMQFKLKKKLRDAGGYDYVIIDTPPSLGLLTLNALTASTHVVIPVQMTHMSLGGADKLMKTVEMVKEDLNPGLDVKGIVLTMYDKRNGLSAKIEDTVRSTYTGKVFDTVIPINVDLAASPGTNSPIILSSKESRGAYAYMNLAREFIEKEVN